MEIEWRIDSGKWKVNRHGALSMINQPFSMGGWVGIMTAEHQITEASQVGWADARKPIVKAAWAALSLSPSYKTGHYPIGRSVERKSSRTLKGDGFGVGVMTANHQVAEASVKYLVDATGQTVPVGYKKTEVGVIPEDWEYSSLKEVSSFGGGTTPARNQFERYYSSGIHPWVKTLDLNNGAITKTEEYVTNAALAETSLKKHKAGSVLVAMYGGFNQIVRTGLLKIDAAINQALVAIIPDIQKLNSEYLLFNLNFHVDYWKGVASSSRKDPNITSNNVKGFVLPLPSVKEQTAIANALSDVDALINELEKQIAKKQAIKTATMQQLLTGRTRLPPFALREGGTQKGYKQSELGEIPEDWDILKLGQIGKFKNGINKDGASFGHGFPFVNLMDVFGKPTISSKTDLGLINSTELDRKEYGLKEGDILFIRSSVKPSGVGLTTVIQQDLEDTVYSGFLISA